MILLVCLFFLNLGCLGVGCEKGGRGWGLEGWKAHWMNRWRQERETKSTGRNWDVEGERVEEGRERYAG